MPTQNSISTTGPGIVQVVTSSIATNTDYTATMPGINSSFISSDSIPQQTDGTEVLTVTIVPRFATSNILIEYIGNCGFQGAGGYINIVSLFKDAGANAIATTAGCLGYYTANLLTYQEAAGSTASRTYKIRMGPNLAAKVVSINGKSGSRYLGGTQACRLIAYEVLV